MACDLNCDLGEGEPPAHTRALMRWITSANIACGGHAGDARSMRRCVNLAKKFGVRVGAHPGPWSRADKGRGPLTITPDELELLLLQQVGALEKIATSEDVTLHHVKLHGALYHAVEGEAKLARRYVAVIREHWPGLVIVALARGGRVLGEARRAGVPAWAEAFADRAYNRRGRLVPRTQAGAVLEDLPAIEERVRQLLRQRQITTFDGRRLRLTADTVCIHADSPNAAAVAKAIVAYPKSTGRE